MSLSHLRQTIKVSKIRAMSKVGNKATKIVAEGLVASSLGLPLGTTIAARLAGKYAKKKASEKIKKYRPF